MPFDGANTETMVSTVHSVERMEYLVSAIWYKAAGSYGITSYVSFLTTLGGIVFLLDALKSGS